MTVVGNRELGILIASLILVILASQAVPAEALTSITKIAVVAGDSAGISAISTQGGQKLIEDSFGKTIAIYVDGTGRIGVTYANSNPTIASNWATPVKAPGATFGYHRPAAVLASPSSLRIITEDGTGVGHINDLPVAISRDSQNNIIGLSFGTRVSLDTSGGAHYPAATLAHNGDILAVWWQNATSSSIVKAFRWRPGIGWRGFSGSPTVPDNAIVDTSDLDIIYPSLVQRGDNRHVYLFGNRAESSPNKNIVFNKATFSGTNWSWGTQNLAYETNSARGLFDVPSAVWDPIRQLVVVIYDISGFERYAVFTLTSSDVKTHIDTPTLNIANNEWGNIELHEPTGEYYIFMIDSVDPVANHDNGRIGYIKYNGASWETSLTIIDSDTNNIGISMKRTGSNSTMEFLYTDNSGGSPNQLKFVRILQVENASTVVFTATEDASVIADQPNTNFGTAATLEVDSGPVAKNFLLKFQLSGLPSHQPIEARLRLFCATTSGASSNRGGDFYTTSDSWTETTVTWNNAPGVVPGLVASLGAVSSNSWVEVDITSIITGNGPLNIKVLPASSDGADYSSSEGTNPPELVITFSNSPPVLSPIGSKNVSEGTLLTFAATATDADNDLLTFSLGAEAPVGASITPAGLFSWTPAENQGPNSHQVTVIVSDGNLSDNETISITVNEVNRPPLLTVPGPLTVSEEDLLTFTVTASDPDLPANTVTLSSSGLPPGATFNPVTGAFTWTTSESQGPGDYTVTFTASDNGLPTMSNSSTVAIHVNEVNLAPSLSVPGAQTINELQPLTFTVNATDPDIPANTVTLACTNCASIGATFNPATGQFSWTPTEAQGPADFTVTFTATDNGSPTLSDTELVAIHVNEVNLSPALTVPSAQTVDELVPLTFAVTCSDSDVPSNTITLSASGLPSGATFNPITGQFTWEPSEAQGPGSFLPVFTCTDNETPSLSDTESVAITVNEVPLPPVLASIGDKTVNEEEPLSFNATATDPDTPANTLSFSLDVGAPSGATIDPSTGVFSWTPGEAQGPGSFTVTIIVSDGSLTDSETISITVNEVNRAPSIIIPGPLTASEGSTLTLVVNATDPDLPGGTITISASNLPPGSSFDPSTRAFTWTPSESQGPGDYTVTFTATDNGVPVSSDNKTLNIHVNEVNQPPSLTVPADQSVDEGDSFTFSVSAVDSDLPSNVVSLSAPSLPGGASFNPSTGTFSWTPTPGQQGTYVVLFTAADNGSPQLSDSKNVTIVVRAAVLVVDFDFTAAATSKPVNFNASASGGTPPYVFSWDFGDGSTGAGVTVSHSYSVKGSYNVTLTVTDSANRTSNASAMISVSPQPLQVTISHSEATSGKPVAFTALPVGGTGPYAVAWRFGDGTTGSGTSTTHIFPVKGAYAVLANVTDANGLVASVTVSVIVSPQPLVAELVSSSPTAGKPVSFNATASGGTSPYVFTWAFGDGTGTSTGTSASHVYSVKGTYNVTLVVLDSNNATTTTNRLVTVTPQPLVLILTVSGATAGKPASFTASVAGGTGPYTLIWDFGDNSTGTGGSVSHAYATKGAYATTVSVTDANNASSRTTQTVAVTPQPLTAIASCGTATSGKSVACSASASGGTSPYLFSWDVSEDGTVEGTGPNFAFTFPTKGTFALTVNVTDANSTSASITVSVAVNPQPLLVTVACPDVGLTAGKPFSCDVSAAGGSSPYTGTGSQSVALPVKGTYTVSFTVTDANGASATGTDSVIIAPQPLAITVSCPDAGLTAGKPFTCAVSAAGGTSPYTGTGSQSVVFPVKGTYNVSLAVTDANGANATGSDSVVISPQPLTITASCSTATAGKPAACSANASGGTGPYSFKWDVAKDGTIDGTGAGFDAVFPVKGSYSIDAIVHDANGDTARVNVPVTIAPQPLTVTGSCQSGTAGKPVTCTASSTGGTQPYAFTWDVGKDGTIEGTEPDFVTSFAVKGSYSVDTIVADANGQIASVNLAVTVAPQPLSSDFASSSPRIIGQPVSFTATASGGTSPYTFAWNFGDGGSGSGSTVSHTYSVKGIYNVTLAVADANNSTFSVSRQLGVSGQVVTLTALCNNGTTGKPLTCNASVSGGTAPYIIAWTFGDGGTGSGFSVSHVFTVKGTYVVTVNVTDANLASATRTLQVSVAPQPLLVDFVISPSSPLAGEPVTLTASVSGGTTPYAFSWSFGDGSNGVGSPVSHTYGVKGSYNISLVVTEANNVVGMVSRPLTVSGRPLTASITAGDATSGKPVTLSATASGGTAPYTISWNFGDSSTEPGATVSHIYNVKGSYTVRAIVTDANLANTTSTTVVVVTPQALVITGSCGQATAGKPVTCNVSASGGTSPYSFSWDLGKDGTVDGTGPSFTHVFPAKGAFSIDATVRDANNATSTVNLSVVANPQPLTVSAQCSSGTSGKPVNCSSSGSGGTLPYVFGWDVGKDGSFETTGSNFTWTFPVKGPYSIDAVVIDANGASARVNVPVTIGPQPLTATVGTTAPQPAGQPTAFSASISGGTMPYTAFWEFGDGTNGTGNPTTHVYAVKGSYSVRAVVTDANRQNTTLTVLVSITPQPLEITAGCTSTSGTAGKPVSCEAIVSGGTAPYSFSWTFSDGAVGSSSTLSHVFAVKGTYAVTVNATDANLASATGSFQVHVVPQSLQAGITVSPSPVAGESVTFTATASGGTAPYGFAWTFSDGGTNSSSSVSHVFAVKGTYTITVNTTDANSASSVTTLDVSVAPQPLQADLAVFPSSPIVGESVTFTGSASGGTAPYTFFWNFGDSFTGNGSSVSHNYSVKGTYSVELVARDANNVSAPVSRQLLVTGQPLTATVNAGNATAGKPVTLSATVFGGTTPYTVSWNFGDSSTGAGEVVAHVYTVKGSFTVLASITDANSANTTSTTVVVVTPQALVITGSCGQATAGKPVTCNVSASGGTSPYSFSWDLGKDGTVDGTGPSFTQVFPVKASYSIDAAATDSNGGAGNVNLALVVQPQPLTITAQCSQNTAGKPLSCSSSGSGGTLPYVFGWDVGKDGSFETTGSNFTWTFPVKGPYSIDAVLIDANGAIASVNIPVTVAPQPLAASISTTTRPAGSPTNFSALISGGTAPYTVFWSFGDGANSTGNPVSHVYAVKGSYNATAVITDANAQNTSSTVMVNIAPQPLQVNAQCDTGGTAGKPINCEAIVSGGTAPYSFAWNFGDGETGSGTPVFHVYSVKGSYNVTLTVSDANSAATILSRVVLLAPQPLTVNAFCDTAIVGVPVTCTASLSGGTSPYSFSWIFSDGGAGSGPSVNHTFPAKGLYTVTVNATDANLASASLSFQVAVSPEPLLVSFDFSPSLPSAGKPVSFNATASGGTSPYSFNWSFGDGTNGVGGSMGHTYVVKGSYNVSLTVTDVNGAVATVSRTLTVSAQPLVALINAGNATAGKPATLSLSVSGGTGPYLVVWDFGDNSTGTGETASHVYSVKGSYTVTATATDFNSATAVASVTVTVIPQPLVVSAICGQATAGKPVFCDSATSGGTGPYQFSWDLGKDGTIDGTSSSFTTVFSVKGSYSVDAIVADANGATASINLVVAVGPQPLTVTPQCSDGTAGKPVFCSASASGGTSPYVFGWDVGKDGSVDGTGSNLTTTFPVKGSYSVDVVVIDANDASNRVNLVVRVLPQPFTADFTIDGTSVAGVSLNFTATASGGTPPYLFAWMFGDGNSGTGSGATHIYTVKGSYTVTLNVTDANGTMLSISRGIVVAPQPLTVTISPSSATAGNPVEFTATITGGTGPYSVSWTFGDATNGSGNPVTHVYSVKGSYNVSATVMDVNGEVMVSTLSVIVAPQPLLADFTMSAGTVSVGEDLVLAATVSGGTPPYVFSWSFGDGLTATGQDVVHGYSVKGSYTITLNATDVNGAVSTSTKTVAVLPLPLVIRGVNVVPAQPSVGDTATFTATITGGTAPYMVVWDLTGDNVSDAQGNPVGWTYSLAQNVTIRIYANDANGATSPVVTTTITVVPFPISEFQFDWADADNLGKVDIVDVATAAACFDLTSNSPVWSNCAYWDFDLDDRIGIVEIARVADQFDTIVTSPFPGEGQAAGVMDPQWHEFCYLLAPIDRAYCESRLG